VLAVGRLSCAVLSDRCWHIVPNALAVTEDNNDDSECLFLHKFPVKLSRYTASRHREETHV